MSSLPPFLSPSPEQEALELGLDYVIFDPLAVDARTRAEAKDDETPPLRAYAVLDASQSPDISICLKGFNDPARCLFDGQAYDDLAEVAPWVVEFTRYSDAWYWFIEEGYGQNWGIFVHSRLDMPRLKTQLKKFLKIEDEDGDVSFFKYYRPQHLNAYLPAFTPTQLERFMLGIEAMYAEYQDDTTKLLMHKRTDDGTLKRSIADLIETGDPLRVQPASPDAAQALITAAKGTS